MEKSVIKVFIKEHSSLFCNDMVARGLYLRMDCAEVIVLEYREFKNQRRTFVFEFGCGYLESCKTEINTMEKYLMDISKSDHAEYITF